MGEYLNATTHHEALDARRNAYTIGVAPIAYPDGSIWRQAVSDWEDGDASRPHVVTRAPIMVSVADGGDRRLHPTREWGRFFGIGRPFTKDTGSWQQVSFGPAVRTANRISWSRPQARVDVLHGGHFCKLGIELLQGYVPAGGQVAFPVAIQGLTRQGANILADGVVVGRLRAPHVEDLSNPEDVRPVAWEFVNLGGQAYLLCTLPSVAGMVRPYIDPTYEITPADGAGRDTYLRTTLPNTNYGTNTQLAFASGWSTLIGYDVSTIPATDTCDSATHYLYHGAPGVAGAATVSIFSVAAANGDWAQLLATWNNKDKDVPTAWAGGNSGCQGASDYEAGALGSFVGDRSDAEFTEYSTTLTAARVQQWWDGTGTNYGLLFTTPNNLGFCYSSNYATDPTKRPKLVIVTTAAGGDQTAAPSPAVLYFFGANPLASPGVATVSPAAGVIALLGGDPAAVPDAVTVSPDPGILSLLAISPGVSPGAVSVSPATAVLRLLAAAGTTTSGGTTASPDAALLRLLGVAPVISGATTVSPDPAVLSLLGISPTASPGAVGVSPEAALLRLAGGTPSVSGATTVQPDPSVLGLVAAAATAYLQGVGAPSPALLRLLAAATSGTPWGPYAKSPTRAVLDPSANEAVLDASANRAVLDASENEAEAE